jgi:hypothetical protein
MDAIHPIVISASRRTDIPAFYMEWFMERIASRCFSVINPFNQVATSVCAAPEAVHSIVFWSKNFGPFLVGCYGEKLERMGYHLFFHFTINSENALLEPRIPPLEERLRQLRALCGRFPREAITWRFDPICHYRLDQGPIRDNQNDFLRIADEAASCGITRCVTSFMNDYAKIRKRIAKQSRFSFHLPPAEEKREILLGLEKALAARGISLHTCCEGELMAALPKDSSVLPSSCISHELLARVYGGSLSGRKDAGQRLAQGCGCMTARDVGSYRHQPCLHGCLYCYANPAA